MNRCTLQQCLLQLQFVFFRHAACAHQTPQREFAKAAFCLYQMFYPKGVANVNRFIARICFSCTFFKPSLSVKKHLPPQVLQQKSIFHSKKFVFYSILFSCTFFKPSLSVKNIYRHKFYNKKAFFTQKNLFFTQFCFPARFLNQV